MKRVSLYLQKKWSYQKAYVQNAGSEKEEEGVIAQVMCIFPYFVKRRELIS